MCEGECSVTEGGFGESQYDKHPTPPCRLAPGSVGGFWLPAAAAPDRHLLVPVLPSHLLLLHQLPLLP